MSVTVILEADVKPESKSNLLKLLSEYLPETNKYKGFISISTYLNWRTETGVMNKLADTFNSPPSIRYFNTEEFNDNSV
ncbi:hypothetical protein ACPSKX_18370 [Moritella viscosa]